MIQPRKYKNLCFAKQTRITKYQKEIYRVVRVLAAMHIDSVFSKIDDLKITNICGQVS